VAIEKQGDGSFKITLQDPLRAGSVLVTELIVRPMRAKHMGGMPLDKAGMQFSHLLEIAGRLTGQPPIVLGEIHGQDLAELLEVVGGFFSAFLPTGDEPSLPSPTAITGLHPS
jgi:hypothetical protein